MLRPDNTIAILGFGVEGKALLNYLIKHGFYKITVCDRNPECGSQFLKDIELPEKVEKDDLVRHIRWSVGKNYMKGMEGVDVIFRSPGIHFQTKELVDAVRNGSKMTSSTALFIKNAPGKIIGVTGTKGKGTTSSLIYEILKESGKDVYLGGNIGRSPLEFMDDLKADSITVLELSSFQLQDLNVSPHISVVLNTTIEHMDYHAHMEEYWEAKATIVRNQDKDDFVVLNADYDYARYFAGLSKARPILVSTKKEVAKPKNSYYVRNVKIPIGVYMQKDAVVMKMPSGKNLAVCKKDEIGLIGPHNLENVLPAVAVTATLGVDVADIKKAVIGFQGLPHRLELVGEIAGVKYYNDSFSTTPETCMAAINSFQQPIVLLVGGSEKNSDFEELAKEIVRTGNLKTVIFMGNEAANRIYDEVLKYTKKVKGREVPLKMVKSGSFGEAFLAARSASEAGDVVLLSPACASFDWFANYKKRGESFREMVENVRAL